MLVAWRVLLPNGILHVMLSPLTLSLGKRKMNNMSPDVRITNAPVANPIIGLSEKALKASNKPAAQYASAANPTEARVTVPNR